jgi:hypothetical protein
MKIDPRVLPTVLIVIDCLAAIGYIPTGEWRKIFCWLSAATLTYCVTY